MSDIFRDEGTGRDAKLAALYRAAAREEPPPALDDAIRAAARRAVASRPQRVITSFIRAWRVPLSIAAVMVLTVSLVTIMREEAPEIMLPAGGRPSEADQKRAGPAADTGESATVVPKTLPPHAQRSDGVGLRPPAQTGSSGIGLRDSRVAPDSAAESRKDMAAAGRMETDAPARSAPAKRAPPEAFPGADGARANKLGAPAEKLRQLAKDEASPAPARAAETVTRTPAPAALPATIPAPAAGATAEGKVQSKPEPMSADAALRETSRARVKAAPGPQSSASPPASAMGGATQSRADLAPEKWLERIEDLRRQGKFEEARTSLAEFRKRFPDYELPVSFKDWAGP